MWWLYVPMRFDDFMLCLIIQEEPDGYRSLNDCHRVWKDGRVEQLGWPQVAGPLRLGHPGADRRDHHLHHPRRQAARDRGRVAPRRTPARRRRLRRRLRLEPRRLEGRGLHRAASPTTSPPPRSPAASCSASSTTSAAPLIDGQEGWGLFEHGAIGRHDPSGFADWFTLAP